MSRNPVAEWKGDNEGLGGQKNVKSQPFGLSNNH